MSRFRPIVIAATQKFIVESSFVPEGRQVLMRAGEAVYVGALGDPIEDVEFDGVVLSPADFLKLKETIS